MFVLVAIGVAACRSGMVDEALAPSEPRTARLSAGDSGAPVYNLSDSQRIPGRYIVMLKDGVRDAHAATEALAKRFGGRVRSEFGVFRGFSTEMSDSAIDALRRDPSVKYVEAVVKVTPYSMTDESQYYPPWPLDRVDQRYQPLDGMYYYQTQLTGAGVRVWIVDGGVDPNDAEFQGRVDQQLYYGPTILIAGQGYTWLNPFVPCSPHGTDVAKWAAGATSSVAKQATINVARIFYQPAEGAPCESSSDLVVNALDWIMGHSSSPAVINMSFGYVGVSWAMDDAVRYAANHGVPVVIAAGNQNINACNVTPAKVGEGIVVAASNYLDQKVATSNWGNCVDIFAPMTDVGGTSHAAGLVTGYVTILKGEVPSRSPNTIMQIMASNSTQGLLTGIGSGSPNRLMYVR